MMSLRIAFVKTKGILVCHHIRTCIVYTKQLPPQHLARGPYACALNQIDLYVVRFAMYSD